MQFNLRSRKLTIEPLEIEEGKYYIFSIGDISDQHDFDAAMMALIEGLKKQNVRGLVVTKPITATGLDVIAEKLHWHWVAWSQKVVISHPNIPEELVSEWKALQIPYSELPEEAKNAYREQVRSIIDNKPT